MNQNTPKAPSFDEALALLDQIAAQVNGSRNDHTYRQLCVQIIDSWRRVQLEYISDLQAVLKEHEIAVPDVGQRRKEAAEKAKAEVEKMQAEAEKASKSKKAKNVPSEK